MENTNETAGYVAPAEPKRWYHNGWFSRSFLIVAGLFFFLPFIDIKCSGTKLASVKGSDMIFGKELKLDNERSSEEGVDSTSTDEESDQASSGFNLTTGLQEGDNKHIAPNALAIGAFASVIVALALSFFAKRIPVILGGGFALLSTLSLFFIQFQVHNEVETKLGPMLAFAAFTFEFTPFYWTCLMFLTLAAAFSFVRSSAFSK